MLAEAANFWLFGISACAMIGTLGTGIFTLIGQRQTARKVIEVHALVNSNLGAAYDKASLYMGRLAALTGTVEDQKLASEAAKMASDHALGQANADAGKR